MLPCQRSFFEIPEDIAFFNCAFLGPLPKAARIAGERAIAAKAHPWTLESQDFFDSSELLRQRFADLLNTAADNIALTPSASYGLAVAAANLPLQQGGRILLLEQQFPSNVYVWREVAAQRGLSVTTVARPADGDWTAALLRAIDDTVTLAALPHCHWVDGGYIDLGRIRDALDTCGGSLAVDVTQSLGVMALDATAIRPDAVVGAGYKWLLGPYSQAFLYMDPQHQHGEPIEYNWITRAGSQDFTQIANYTDSYQAGARRYDAGERSNFITVPMMAASLEHILDWGVPRIAERTAALSQRIADAARSNGFDALPDAVRSPHYLTLEKAGGDSAAMRDALAQEGVHVSVRGTRVRACPHVYNSDDDVDRLITALARA